MSVRVRHNDAYSGYSGIYSNLCVHVSHLNHNENNEDYQLFTVSNFRVSQLKNNN